MVAVSQLIPLVSVRLEGLALFNAYAVSLGYWYRCHVDFLAEGCYATLSVMLCAS